MTKPLCIDLFTGLHGWSEGFLAEGWRVVGFDLFDMCKETGIARSSDDIQLVLQDVLTVHGKQFKTADCIVASPPCQNFSYMAMPWSRAKAIAAEYRNGTRDTRDLTALFDACFRIQREAIEAAGHFIPLVVENVRGAIPWVGRSRWNYGSFHLWGDVPALMPMTKSAGKSPKGNSVGAPLWKDRPINSLSHATLTDNAREWYGFVEGKKVGSWPDKRRGAKYTAHMTNPGEWGTKAAPAYRGDCSGWGVAQYTGSKSKARKAASAAIAKIPLPLARHIAAYWKPR